jgi:hypothetical protein
MPGGARRIPSPSPQAEASYRDSDVRKRLARPTWEHQYCISPPTSDSRQ